MEYRLLGPFEVQAGDRLIPLGGSKQRALLALLVLNANRVVGRDRMIDGLWGERPPSSAVETVQVYVSRLRKLLPTSSLLTQSSGYLLKVEPEAVDVLRFERLVGEAKLLEAEQASELLRSALDLWRGHPLAEFDHEPFAHIEAARLEDLRLAALEQRLDADLAIGRHADLVGELETLIVEYPYRERLRAQLMLALYRSDRQAEALSAYRDARAMLDELGVEPSRRLRALERSILTQDPTLDPTPSQDLGQGQRAPLSTNLPRPASSFVGREREVSELTSLIRGDARLVTISGSGGSGKTRLAIEVALRLVGEFEDGLVWVGLAPIHDPLLVGETIAQTLDAKGDLGNWIGTNRILLLLDNFEQVIGAASEVAGLVEACPNLRVLITSRERLRVRGEIDYPALPLASVDAVELFATRAQIEPDEIVVELCRRLDNFPLALELAAARTAVLNPSEIVDRLSQRLDLFKGGRDADPRQQTLRATIEWSHDLLNLEESRVFRGFAVFRGGATLDAAEQIVGATLDTLQSLVDKSLLRHSDGRFWMHETIQEFGRERLVAYDEEQAIAERHLSYFLHLAEEAAVNMGAKAFPEWLARLEVETDNLRQVLERCRTLGERELELRVAASIWRFWLVRGRVSEGRRRLEEALAAVPTDSLVDIRTEALLGAAGLARVQGDHEEAQMRGRQARDLAVASADRKLVLTSLNLLATIAVDRNKLDEAAELLDETLELARATEDWGALSLVTNNRGYLALAVGEHARGVALCEDALLLAREKGNELTMAQALLNIGFGSLELGHRDRALSAFRDSVELTRRLGHTEWMAYAAEGLAAFYVTTCLDHALSLLAAAVALRASVSVQLDPFERQFHDRTLETLRANLSTETIDAAFREAGSLTLDQIFTLMLASVDCPTDSDA